MFPPEEDDEDDEYGNDIDDLKPGAEPEENFKQMILDLVLAGFADGSPPESLLMEVKGSKFAHNKSFANCVESIVPGLLQICFQKASVGAGGVFSLKDFIVQWQEFVKKDAGWGYNILRSLIFEVTEE